MSTLLLGRICRTCLLESSTMHKLLDMQIEVMLNQTFPTNFERGLGDPIDEFAALPLEICGDCLEIVVNFYNFQNMVWANNEKLRSLIKHQEVEAVFVAAALDTNDKDFLKDDSEVRDCLGDFEESESLKSEPDKLAYEVQNVLDKLEKEVTKEDEFLSLETTMHDVNGDEIKIETESVERITNEYELLECEGFVDEDNVNNDDDDDEDYWPTNDGYDSDDSKCNLNNNQEDVSNPKTKTTRKYNKRNPSKSSNKICTICHKTFKKRMFLTRHMSVHSEDNTFVCDVCEYRFATERLLKIHISYKHNKGETISLAGGPYQCPDCPMVFQQTRALASHRVMHAERNFKCKICGVNLKTLSAVTRHMNCKHPGVLPYQCQICNTSFPVETHFTEHMNMHKGQKKHKCDNCDKSFPNSTALKDHMRSHTGESPYLCSHCGKSFKTSNILRQHLQRHGEKNFQCPECPMRFYAKVNLQKHMCTHSKEKKYVCDVCGSSFTRGDSLKSHRFKHSGERPFKCEECNMSFVFKRHLLRHKITHTGEKPHMCNYCDRAYAASGDLVKHLRTHVGENTYFCDECPQTFKYRHELRDHKNQHYKEKNSTTTEVVVDKNEETQNGEI